MEDRMSAETTRATAEKLLAHCRAHTTKRGLDELYDPDAVSVEATLMQGMQGRETHGVPAIKGKHDWWDATMDVHAEKIEGPYPHGDDRFAVIFGFDATNKQSGERVQMQEVAVYTVDGGGKIVREEFFYG
jgi:ketosteroid isomerase-like protein